MNKIKIAERRFLTVSDSKRAASVKKFIGRRDGIVARTGDFSRSVFCKLSFAKLE